MNFSKSIYGSLIIIGIPLIGSNVAQYFLTIIDTAMLGHYNPVALASVVIAGIFFFSIFIVGSGFSFAIIPLVSAYNARGETKQIRRITRMGLWMAFIYTMIMLGLFLNSEKVLVGIGQSLEVASFAQDYLRIMGFGIFPALLFFTLRNYLTGLKHTQVTFWVTITVIPLKIVLNWVFIFGNLGMPELGIRGAAFSTLAVQTMMVALLIIYVNLKLKDHNLFNRLWIIEFPHLKKIFTLGLPIGLTYLAETSLFTATAVMMGWLGTVELAAHGITMQLAGLSFMFHVGLSQAATTVTGHAYGKHEGGQKLRKIGEATIGLSIAYALIIIALFVFFPRVLLSLFLDKNLTLSEEILSLATTLLMIAAVFHLVDGLQATGLGLLRGIQDVRVPFMLALVSYWIFGIGSGYVLAFVFELGSIGLWFGLVIGLTIAAIGLIWRYWFRTSGILNYGT